MEPHTFSILLSFQTSKQMLFSTFIPVSIILLIQRVNISVSNLSHGFKVPSSILLSLSRFQAGWWGEVRFLDTLSPCCDTNGTCWPCCWWQTACKAGCHGNRRGIGRTWTLSKGDVLALHCETDFSRAGIVMVCLSYRTIELLGLQGTLKPTQWQSPVVGILSAWGWALSTFRDGETTASLGSLWQRLPALLLQIHRSHNRLHEPPEPESFHPYLPVSALRKVDGGDTSKGTGGTLRTSICPCFLDAPPMRIQIWADHKRERLTK